MPDVAQERKQNMKGVVLAGGLGSRLEPLTRITNKHLLPIYDRPMIYYPIQMLVDAGIRDIMIVTGGNYAGDFLRLIGNGEDFGLSRINYAYQKGEGGIAEALGLTREFVGDDKLVVVLGDNILESGIASGVKAYAEQPRGELEITDVNNAYIDRGEMEYEMLEGWWLDAGENHESLLHANLTIAKQAGVQI